MHQGGPGSVPAADVVVVVASAGGVRALRTVLPRLPAGFPAAVLVVQHRPAVPDLLPDLLRPVTPLPVDVAVDGAPVRPGRVVLAPADRQLLLTSDLRLRVTGAGGAGDHCAGDPLLTSVAAAYGPRTLAVVLTGRLADGEAGVVAVRGAGGRVVVQDPDTAEQPGMPRAALATGCADLVLPLDVVGDAVTALVMAPGAADLFRPPLPWWARAAPPPPGQGQGQAAG